MDEDEVFETIISTRARRSNAGNRLKTLLQMQEPLSDEDEIFAEVENDDEFDLDASPSEESAQSGDEEEEGEGGAETAEQASNDEAETGGGGDDENFTDSSDSEIENDPEEADAGEKALVKEQRESAREQRKSERNKMFRIKEHKPAAAKAPTPKKKTTPGVETLLDTERRVSKRESAIRMKTQVIERLRENERRRAEYVAPVVREKVVLTQEERLAEAKITEMKNTASLRRFVEIEEYRKQQRRLALLGKRARLTEFVRWKSATLLEYPKVNDTEDDDPKPIDIDEEEEEKDEPAGDAMDKDQSVEPKDTSEAPEDVTMDADDAENDGDENDAEASVEPEDADKDEQDEAVKDESNKDQAEELQANAEADEDTKQETKEEPDSVVKTEDVDLAMPPPRLLIEELSDHEPEEPEIREVEGPPSARPFSSLTFHDFEIPINNKLAVRKTVLGPVGSKSQGPPPKRLCAINGVEAKYLDPRTGLAYYSLATFKYLQKIRDQSLGWSNELGGVYLAPRENPRHAKGVPEGFARPNSPKEDQAESKPADVPPVTSESSSVPSGGAEVKSEVVAEAPSS